MGTYIYDACPDVVKTVTHRHRNIHRVTHTHTHTHTHIHTHAPTHTRTSMKEFPADLI